MGTINYVSMFGKSKLAISPISYVLAKGGGEGGVEKNILHTYIIYGRTRVFFFFFLLITIFLLVFSFFPSPNPTVRKKRKIEEKSEINCLMDSGY